MKHFIKLPSGIVINIERLSMVGRLNAIKEPNAKKPKEWDLSMQFINEDRPTILEYRKEDEARADYDALVAACVNSD